MKTTLFAILFMFTYVSLSAQNIIIQQNNADQSKVEERIVEKTVYVEKQEPKKPKPTTPVLIMGYIYVFPETFRGEVEEVNQIIMELNQNNAYGHNDWRLPTMAELRILYSHRDKLPEIMDLKTGYLSSEFIRTYNHYGTGSYPLHKILDVDGRHWSVESGASISGTAVLVCN